MNALVQVCALPPPCAMHNKRWPFSFGLVQTTFKDIVALKVAIQASKGSLYGEYNSKSKLWFEKFTH